MNALPASRREAMAAGSVHFFTGKPCRYGHVSQRYTTSGICLACCRRATPDTAPTFPAQRVHPDEVENLLALVDHLNAKHGMPPAIRPGELPPQPVDDRMTLWERHLQRHLLRNPTTIIWKLAERWVATGGTEAYGGNRKRPLEYIPRPVVSPTARPVPPAALPVRPNISVSLVKPYDHSSELAALRSGPEQARE